LLKNLKVKMDMGYIANNVSMNGIKKAIIELLEVEINT